MGAGWRPWFAPSCQLGEARRLESCSRGFATRSLIQSSAPPRFEINRGNSSTVGEQLYVLRIGGNSSFSKQMLPQNRISCYSLSMGSACNEGRKGQRTLARSLHMPAAPFSTKVGRKRKKWVGSAQPAEKAHFGQGNQSFFSWRNLAG